MIANTKIEIILIAGEKESFFKNLPGRQVTKDGPITADYLKSQMPADLFDTKTYKKVKDEVWGSSLHAPLNGDTVVHNLPNLTYTLYITSK